ncbi:hypothetical protein I551_5610 [Mycobacterium ulcerans str. Harvey]|uniref:Uncharacterized protein n=1 Tax=Mycobacterium ulcerans str. Harvey TaxID=1299332 RepID=A0ABN0QTD9_MYCUL|nr:hypothetical protein I551_5610 [Mycobacterium ulcerans str. Harvey]
MVFAGRLTLLTLPEGVNDQQNHTQCTGADAHPRHQLIAGDHREHQRNEPNEG